MPCFAFFSKTLSERGIITGFMENGMPKRVKGTLWKKKNGRIVAATLCTEFESKKQARKYLKEEYSKLNPDAILVGKVFEYCGEVESIDYAKLQENGWMF